MASRERSSLEDRLQEIIANLQLEKSAIDRAIKAIEGYERLRKRRSHSDHSLHKLIQASLPEN